MWNRFHTRFHGQEKDQCGTGSTLAQISEGKEFVAADNFRSQMENGRPHGLGIMEQEALNFTEGQAQFHS